MEKTDRLIWSNREIDYKDWKDDLESEHPELTEDERKELMYSLNDGYLDDERHNLDIQLSCPIIVIADLGLWNGRRSGYKEIPSGNIKDCLYSECDYNTWYVDKYGDLRCEAIDHDGTSYYLYRTYKDNVTDTQIENFKWKIYNGTVTRADINRVTRRLGDEIGKVHGWEFPQRQKAELGAR